MVYTIIPAGLLQWLIPLFGEIQLLLMETQSLPILIYRAGTQAQEILILIHYLLMLLMVISTWAC